MKSLIKSTLLLVVAIGATAFTTKTLERVDIKSSTIKWTGKKVTGQHHGTIDLKEGYFEMDGENITGGQFVIDMSSIKNLDLDSDSRAKLEGHLKSPDFFGVEKYPTATLAINSTTKTDKGYAVKGDLTIKEITQPITFDLMKNGNTATAKMIIDRSKFDVRYGSGSFFENLGDKTIYDDFELDITLNM